MAESVMIKMVSPGAGGRAWEIGPRHWAASDEPAPIAGDYRCAPGVPFRVSAADAPWFLDSANDHKRGNRRFEEAAPAKGQTVPMPSGADPMASKAAPDAPAPEKREAPSTAGKASKGAGA